MPTVKNAFYIHRGLKSIELTMEIIEIKGLFFLLMRMVNAIWNLCSLVEYISAWFWTNTYAIVRFIQIEKDREIATKRHYT